MKKWRTLQGDTSAAPEFAEMLDIPVIMAAILMKKGFEDEMDMEEFLAEEPDFSDPFEIEDMDIAVERILSAVESGEKICIYGDYDADGVTSTSMLYMYLKSLWAEVMYYIPEREKEGYGLNNGAVDKLSEMNVDLIITVDNGISAAEQVAYASSLGIDTVVTDHHEPPEELPEAVAVVDPHRHDDMSEFKDLCGAGVVLKLIMAMEMRSESLDIEDLLDRYSDICAVGTVADVVSLTGENRMIVKEGLRRINTDNNLGLSMLRKYACIDEKEVTSGDVGFMIGPRINAGGRLDIAIKAVELLTTDSISRAEEIAKELNEYNAERKSIEKKIIEEAVAKLDSRPDIRNRKIIVIDGEGWHQGVIGLAASRIKDIYGKPTIVITYEGDKAKGSARSVEGFPMVTGVSYCRDLLTIFGGHPMAAGMSLPTDNIELFRNKINEYADTLENEFFPTLDVSLWLKPGTLRVEDIESLKKLEPYGTGNPKPVFGYAKVTITEVKPVKNGQYVRVLFKRDTFAADAMCFSYTYDDFPYIKGDVVNIAADLSINDYMNARTVSSFIKEIMFADADHESMLRSRRIFEAYLNGADVTSETKEELAPDREDFAAIYKLLRANNGFRFAPEVLLHRIGRDTLTYGKLMLCLKAMEELSLITLARKADTLRITLLPVSGKVELMSAPVLKRIVSN